MSRIAVITCNLKNVDSNLKVGQGVWFQIFPGVHKQQSLKIPADFPSAQ